MVPKIVGEIDKFFFKFECKLEEETGTEIESTRKQSTPSLIKSAKDLFNCSIKGESLFRLLLKLLFGLSWGSTLNGHFFSFPQKYDSPVIERAMN
jgi:hypothetical protein